MKIQVGNGGGRLGRGDPFICHLSPEYPTPNVLWMKSQLHTLESAQRTSLHVTVTDVWVYSQQPQNCIRRKQYYTCLLKSTILFIIFHTPPSHGLLCFNEHR